MVGFLRIVALVLFSSILISFSSAEEEVKGLRIGIMKKPKNCPRQSKKGDRITVNYNTTAVDQTAITSTR